MVNNEHKNMFIKILMNCYEKPTIAKVYRAIPITPYIEKPYSK